MKTSTALGVAFGVIVLATAGLFLQTWLLSIILPSGVLLYQQEIVAIRYTVDQQ